MGQIFFMEKNTNIVLTNNENIIKILNSYLTFFHKCAARIWTQNLLVRSQALYPVELQAQKIDKIINTIYIIFYDINNINHKKMYLFFNNQDNQKIYLSILLGIIPFSFIAGNMIININIILLIISSFLIFKTIYLKLIIFLDKLILIFFLILLTAVINDYHFYNLNLEWRMHG